ncbi:MAG: M14 family zinc carboxypeptidase [Gemmatimonadetes bacterium]|nr:M14 family zinc carboxypeptidase [Gemmatimonadota bacterium]MDA1102304.1 M14 family zinc carboxypeptidase [Gemmatimonadota bacterium]
MRRVPLLLTLLALLPIVAVQGVDAQALPQTWQEQQNYRSGPTPFEPLMDFWYELDAISEKVSMRPLTHTLLGREMFLITIANIPITTPQDALRSGKTIVLLAPSVHGGEVSPKEAIQLVAKELVAGDLQSVLDDVIVLALPLVNPDGGEVRRRTNEAGFDMNRDYVKLESQEIQALVTQVMNEWTPDIHVDGHHGGSAPYVITYQGTLNPAADAELRAYPYDEIFPRIREAVRAEDYASFDYSGVSTQDGVRGWGSTSVEARKHHVYTGLTNSIGILLETPNNRLRVMRDGSLREIPEEERYYHQIRGGVIATSTILRHAAERREEIRALTTASRLRAISAGATGDVPVVLEYSLGNRGNEPVWMPNSEAPNGYSLDNVPVYLKWEPTRTTTRPVGYLLPPSMAQVVPLLQDHDIAVYQFRDPAAFDAEVYYATSVTRDSYFQGHYLKSVDVEKEAERVEVASGWYWVPTAQSRGNLITYILEPETDDNVITWGWVDHILQVTADGGNARQRVPMMRVMTHQYLPVVEVQPFNLFQRNRYFRPGY